MRKKIAVAKTTAVRSLIQAALRGSTSPGPAMSKLLDDQRFIASASFYHLVSTGKQRGWMVRPSAFAAKVTDPCDGAYRGIGNPGRWLGYSTQTANAVCGSTRV